MKHMNNVHQKSNAMCWEAFRAAGALKTVVLCALMLAARHPGHAVDLHNQDTWRKMNISFTAPPTSTLRCAAVSNQFFYSARIIGGQPDRIVKYGLDGTAITTFAQEFGYVQGLACDAAGRLFVFDRNNGVITIVDSDGNTVDTFGGLGAANGQFGAHINASTTMLAFSLAGELFACDPASRRVQVFNSSGVFQRAWGDAGALPSQFNTNQPDRIAVTNIGKVFVGNKIFDVNGVYLGASSWYLAQVAPDGIGNYQPLGYDFNPRYPIDPVTGKTGVVYNGPYSTAIQYWATPDGTYDKAGNFYEIAGATASFFKREYRTAPNFPAATAVPMPTVISAMQRSGTNLVDVTYRVDDADNASVQTGLLAFLNGGETLNQAIQMRTFVEGTAGNVGVGQPTGTQRSLVWDMTADWAADFADIRVEVLANDGRNIQGIHWIEIPTDGVAPAVQISANPITNDQLVEVWFWLAATRGEVQIEKDPRYTENRVYADAGEFANATLLEYRGPGYDRQPITTDAGRLFAAKMMGARPVNRVEITRATLGNYNFGTVNEQNFTKGGTSPDANLKSWGFDDYGELDWLPFNGTLPTRVATNGATSLYLGNDNRLWGMGYNGYSQLGTGNTTNQSLAIPIAEDVSQMVLGSNHVVYVDTIGNLFGLGRNNAGQLGTADTSNKTTAALIDTGVTHVAAAGDWTFYVKGNALYQATTSGPSLLIGDVTKVFIGLRGDYFYITSAGDLWGWGLNENGLLGVAGGRSFANRVMIDQNVADGAVGWDFVVYRKTDGSLWGLGENEHNQIHGNSTANVLSPYSMEASDVVEVAVGHDHVHYRRTNNSVYARGRNHVGQLGNGDFSNVTAVVQVDSNVSALAAGGDDSLWITLTTGP